MRMGTLGVGMQHLFRKVIDIRPTDRRLSHRSWILLWGSCFADRLADRLEQELYPVSRAPYGIIYNPLSMAEGMRRLLQDDVPRSEELILHEGRWHSLMHHGDYSGSDRETTLKGMRAAFDRAREVLPKAELIVFTFGTAWVYECEGKVVNNCHKLPPDHFTHRRLTVEEITAAWDPLIDQVTRQAPEAKILLTVSPIPHYRDGAHESRLSKAILLIAVDELLRLHPDRVDYFPSYELLQDELRDYRFYGEDMAHPTPQAADYITERFAEAYLSDESSDESSDETLRAWHKLRPQLVHRPHTADPNTLRQYYDDLLDSLQTIYDRLPHPYLLKEMTRLRQIRSTL